MLPRSKVQRLKVQWFKGSGFRGSGFKGSTQDYQSSFLDTLTGIEYTFFKLSADLFMDRIPPMERLVILKNPAALLLTNQGNLIFY
jgi:hypothetical protein